MEFLGVLLVVAAGAIGITWLRKRLRRAQSQVEPDHASKKAAKVAGASADANATSSRAATRSSPAEGDDIAVDANATNRAGYCTG